MNNQGKIIKAKKTGNFTQIPNEVLRRKDLTWKAKGLLAFLLSLPDDWVVHMSDLHENSVEGLAATKSAFHELQEAGYILSSRVKQENSNLNGGWCHIVYECPQISVEQVFVGTAAVDTALVDTALVDTALVGTKTTIYTNKENTNTEINNTEEQILWPTFDDFWMKYNKSVDKVKCQARWKKLKQKEKEAIMAHLDAYIPATKDKKFRKNPVTYINNKSWENEVINTTDAKRIIANGVTAEGTRNRFDKYLNQQ